LAATGTHAAVMSPPLGDLSDRELNEMKVPLDAELRASLRELAARHGRSQRRMATMVVAAGLVALGADAGVVDEALADQT
jgi:hypothetical protein